MSYQRGLHQIMDLSPRGFDRIITGPLESLPDEMVPIDVSGELLFPSIELINNYGPELLRGSTIYEVQPVVMQYRQRTYAAPFKDVRFRDEIEQQVRREIAELIVDRSSINMRVETGW